MTARPPYSSPLAPWALCVATCITACGDDEASPEVPPAPRFDSVGRLELTVDDVRSRLWPQGSDAWRPRSEEDIQAVAELFEAIPGRITEDGDLNALVPLAERARCVLEVWTVNDQTYLAVLEHEDVRGTLGSFVFRIGPAVYPEPERLLQSPHAFFDLGTGEIGLETFFASPRDLRAFFTNTLHRYRHEDGTKKKREHNPADVCHNPEHPFVVATEATARGFEHTVVIQIHGYGKSHHVSDLPGTWAIVSAGERAGSTPRSSAVARQLWVGFGVPIARYPEDAATLGATTNVLRKALLHHPWSDFVHVELSSGFRKELRARPDWIASFAAALAPEDDGSEVKLE